MATNELGELVKQAKGQDRSLREYARDSGVDASVISKMIKGAYAPKKPEIYRKLTSPQAAPRGGITYEQLIKAVDSSRSYQEGIAAGLAATAGVMAALGALPMALITFGMSNIINVGSHLEKAKSETGDNDDQEALTYNNDMLLEFEKKQRKFRAIALSILVTALVKKGIACKVGNIVEITLDCPKPDEWLTLVDMPISDWWISFWARDEELDERAYVFPSDRAKVIFARYLTAPADPERKISLVLDDSELFDELAKFKGSNSYRGEISIILVDPNSFEIVKEEYVAHYDETDTTREFYAV